LRVIYHLVSPSAWEATGTAPYRAASLETEGFIHCSNQDQVAPAANRFYADQPELFALCIDASRLAGLVRDEDSGKGELFPYIYGPLDRAAVVEVRRLQRDPHGHWVFP
jgi:uncharacterized protein (DUF952 family)